MPFKLLSIGDKEEAWLDLAEGRSIKLAQECTVRISDSGSLEIQRGDSSTTFYPPHSWSRIQVVDPYALASAMMAKQVQEEADYARKIA